MQTVIIVIHLMIVAVLIGAVLLQKSEGGGLGMGGGAGFMSSRGTANLLTRTTAILAVGFFVTSLLLSWLAGLNRAPSSIISSPASQTQPGGATPVAPPTSGGVLDTLKKADEQQKQAPAAPQAPQAPRSQ
jgi:preprotein translocase subunit SecG